MRWGLAGAAVSSTQCLLRHVLRLVYPLHCAACKCPLDECMLCDRCSARLRPLPAGHCSQCGSFIDPTTGCVACASHDVRSGVCYGVYEEGAPLAILIRSFKYQGDRGLVAVLGPLLVAAAKGLTPPDAVTFVPLSRRRQRQRGFNQAALLAQYVAGAYEVPVFDLLRKTRHTTPQAALPRRLRLSNLEGAFKTRLSSSLQPQRPRSLWLVDDVRTTGATLQACARALKRGGIQRVDTLTLAASPD